MMIKQAFISGGVSYQLARSQVGQPLAAFERIELRQLTNAKRTLVGRHTGV